MTLRGGRPLEDPELIERAKRGDTDAYATLVQRYQAFAVQVAYLVSGDVAEAEDAAQQAFVKAYYALDRLRPGASLRPWLLRIVVNEARNLRKAAQRRIHREARAAGRPASGETAPSAEDTALEREERSALLAALMRLREGDRLVISARYFFDLSEAEIAQALGMARGTVKSRLSRALGRLRESFSDLYPLVVPAAGLDALIAGRLGDLAAHLPHQPPEALARAVLGRVGAGSRNPDHPVGTRLAPTLGPVGLAALALALLAAVVLGPWRLVGQPSPPAAPPASQKVVVYGSDLTDAERQEVTELLGANEAREVATVTRAELGATLQAAGLPVVPADEAISSAVLTCLESGRGLRVRTRHITRIPAAAYAHALLTARTINASLVIAAPAARPVSGEAAVVGVLKMAAACEGGRGADPGRVRLAYEQLKVMVELAGEADDLTPAAAVVLHAAQAVITGQAVDEAAIGAALDRAAAAEGLPLSAAQRSAAASVLRQLRDVDYGAYATTYQLQWLSPQDAAIVPNGGR